MKYALNHQLKFLNFTNAFQIGLFQALTTLAVETISLMIIFTSVQVGDVVQNFIALAIIDEFDVFIYEALRSENFKTLLRPEISSQLLKISFTTSGSALSGEMGEDSDCKDLDGKPVCNRIRFWADRGFRNKTYWLVYKLMRFWYVVVYFYFYPLLVVFIN